MEELLERAQELKTRTSKKMHVDGDRILYSIPMMEIIPKTSSTDINTGIKKQSCISSTEATFLTSYLVSNAPVSGSILINTL